MASLHFAPGTVLLFFLADSLGRFYCALRGRRRAPVALPLALFVAGGLIVAMRAASLSAAEQVELPSADSRQPIKIYADQANHWTEGSYDVWVMSGNCLVNQGQTYAHSKQAVLWIEHAKPQNPLNRVIAYLEGDVGIESRGAAGPQAPNPALQDQTWFGRFFSTGEPEMHVAQVLGEPADKPPVYQNARRRRDPPQFGAIQRTQFAEFDPRTPLIAPPAAPGTAPRRVRVFPRGGPIQAQTFPGAAPNQTVIVITSGVNMVVDGLPNYGTVDLSADRVVVWTETNQGVDVNNASLQNPNAPLEVYLEGNVEFRQGERVIRAPSMYYDVRNEIGTVIAADMLSPVPDYTGVIRMRAEILRIVERDRFVGSNTTITTSLIGEPTYSFRSGNLVLEDRQEPVVNPATGQPDVNPQTGTPLVTHDYFLIGRDNITEIDGVPIAYWPYFASDVKRPNFLIRDVKLKTDQIFGTQVSATFDTFEVLGIQKPPKGVDSDFSLDYFTKRGPAFGDTLRYDREGLLGIPGRYAGVFESFTIYDTGLDNMGLDRQALTHPTDFRYRELFQHRQHLPDDFTLTVELGLTSDRNFIEQYFNREWDEFKNESTGLYLTKTLENQEFALALDPRVEKFFETTANLPRFDHYWLGQPLLADYLTWYEHTQLAYKQMRPASEPTDPADAAKFGLFPYEGKFSGSVVSTTQEIDAPFELGPFKFVPYALGQLAHWGEDLADDSLNRAYGQLGLRISLPMEAVDPTVRSELFNVNGLAHKVVFSAQAEYSDASRSMFDLPLYDPLDDWAQQQFRRRYAFNTFGGPPATNIPLQFDPRTYALRSGLADSVTSPSTEVADDLTAVRFDINQRWQTKRGGEDHEHIIDWITLDTGFTIFDAKDNFGQNIGLLNYDFTWHVGDRTTLVSSGLADTFNGAETMWNVGVFLARPPRGNIYIGFRSLGGPIQSNAVQLAFNYRMSPKWVASAGTSYDFSQSGDISEHISFTRVGDSFLTTFGANIDSTRGTAGFEFSLEPRFLPKSRVTQTTGLEIPPAGTFGLE